MPGKIAKHNIEMGLHRQCKLVKKYIMEARMCLCCQWKSQSHSSAHVTDFSVVNVHVDELSSARIWQHKLCATFSANVNINYRLPIKVY